MSLRGLIEELLNDALFMLRKGVENTKDYAGLFQHEHDYTHSKKSEDIPEKLPPMKTTDYWGREPSLENYVENQKRIKNGQ
jgi:hypothetical protein